MSTAEIGKIFCRNDSDKVQIISCTGANRRRYHEFGSSFTLKECQTTVIWPRTRMGFTWKRVKSSNRYLYSWTWSIPSFAKHIYKIWKDADDAGERYLPHEFIQNVLSGVLKNIRNRFER
jgi:deoxyhypusine synthase